MINRREQSGDQNERATALQMIYRQFIVIHRRGIKECASKESSQGGASNKNRYPKAPASFLLSALLVDDSSLNPASSRLAPDE